MDTKLPPKIFRESVRVWNSTARDCYDIGCDCSRCELYELYFKHYKDGCHMKEFVQFLIKKIGTPRS